MKRLLTTLLPGLLASNVWAATYTYTGATYTSLTNHTTAALGSVGDYSNAMKVTGTLTTAAPLAANLDLNNITAQIIGYSFSDGLTTFNSSDTNIRLLDGFNVSTNAAGQITAVQATIERWQSGVAPHGMSGRTDYFMFNGATVVGVHNTRCTAIGVSIAGVADSCTSPELDTNSSEASVAASGAWNGPSVSGGVSVASVPTLSEWALLALVSLMAMFGIARTRRRQR